MHFWLKLFPSHVEIERSMHEFFAQQDHTDSPLVNWEAFNAYLRGSSQGKKSFFGSEGAGRVSGSYTGTKVCQ